MNKTVFSLIAVCATPAVLLSLACTLGFDPPLAELRAGTSEMPLAYAASTQLPIEWRLLRALDPPKATPFLFVHLQNEDGRLVRTFDRPVHGMPAGGDAIEIWQSLLTEPLPAGRYRLVAGLYDPAGGRRWRLETNGVDLGRGKYRLATVEVASTRRTTPDLVFGGEWLEADAGQAHNPGRRWMGERGSIRLLGFDDWSELVLSVSIIELPADRYPLVEGGAGPPRLVIRNGCDGGDESHFEGYGVWPVALRLGGEDNCIITLEPSFTTVGPEGKRRSIGLETAFFRPSIHAD